ncbi:hypothetical protein HDU96_010928 [Phlyctochytrium bullatum]|nr:hypothetical protein HDU96_010928 [Phlyctochytrium bullatum]
MLARWLYAQQQQQQQQQQRQHPQQQQPWRVGVGAIVFPSSLLHTAAGAPSATGQWPLAPLDDGHLQPPSDPSASPRSTGGGESWIVVSPSNHNGTAGGDDSPLSPALSFSLGGGTATTATASSSPWLGASFSVKSSPALPPGLLLQQLEKELDGEFSSEDGAGDTSSEGVRPNDEVDVINIDFSLVDPQQRGCCRIAVPRHPGEGTPHLSNTAEVAVLEVDQLEDRDGVFAAPSPLAPRGRLQASWIPAEGMSQLEESQVLERLMSPPPNSRVRTGAERATYPPTVTLAIAPSNLFREAEAAGEGREPGSHREEMSPVEWQIKGTGTLAMSSPLSQSTTTVIDDAPNQAAESGQEEQQQVPHPRQQPRSRSSSPGPSSSSMKDALKAAVAAATLTSPNPSHVFALLLLQRANAKRRTSTTATGDGSPPTLTISSASVGLAARLDTPVAAGKPPVPPLHPLLEKMRPDSAGAMRGLRRGYAGGGATFTAGVGIGPAPGWGRTYHHLNRNLDIKAMRATLAHRQQRAFGQMMLPVELIQRILLFANDIEVAVAIELILARFPRPFWVRIDTDATSKPIRDAIEPLLPELWKNMNESHFPVSLAISRWLVVEPDDTVETTPAFRLAWVSKFRRDLITFKYVMRAAGAGRLDLIQILDAFEVPRFCMGTMDEAAAAGHLALVKFLHYRRPEGCTSWAMTKAAKGGFLDILRFLHANRVEGCRDSAIIDAAVGGHFDVISFLHTEYLFFTEIDWPYSGGSAWPDSKIPTHHIRRLHEEFGWPITESVMTDVMKRGAPDEFRYCLEKVKEVVLSFDKDKISRAFRFAKMSWLENLKILFETIGHDDQYWEPENLDGLAEHGHLDMLEFLYEKRTERCSRHGLSRAAEFGRADIFNFLITKDAKASSKIGVEVLNSAVEGGNVEIVRILRNLDVPALQRYWNSILTNSAHRRGKTDVVRYLAAELRLPVTVVDFSGVHYASAFDKALFDLEPFHYDCTDPDFYQTLFLQACMMGTVEQVARFSVHVPECRRAFHFVTKGRDRLAVLRFLHENRHEKPNVNCLDWAIGESFETVKFLVEVVGMRPDAFVMTEAACSGNLGLLKFLYGYLPAAVPLDDAISEAIDRGQFANAKFLHMKRRATGPMACTLSNFESNMDVTTFAVENYISQLNVDDAMGRIKSMYFHQMDVCKYILEGGHLNHREIYDVYDPLAYEDSYIELDCFHYLLKAGFINVKSLLPRLFVHNGVSVGLLRVLWQFCPESFTTQTVLDAAQMERLPMLRYLSHVAPQLFDSAAAAAIICICRKPSSVQTEQARLILDRHSEHVKWHEHLAATVKTNTAVAMLLWERWPGGCPRKAMEVACREKNLLMVKKLMERVDNDDPEWKMAVHECLDILEEKSMLANFSE